MAKVKVVVHRGFKNTALKVNGMLIAGTMPFSGVAVEWEVDKQKLLDAVNKLPAAPKGAPVKTSKE